MYRHTFENIIFLINDNLTVYFLHIIQKLLARKGAKVQPQKLWVCGVAVNYLQYLGK